MRGRWVLALGALAALSPAGAARAGSTASHRYRADLLASNEVPPPKHVPHLAGGRFIGRLSGRTLNWTLRFHTLSGKVTGAVLQLGVSGHTGPVVVRLCSPCSSPAGGEAKLTHAQIVALNGKKLYVNVQTVRNPDGELRGQAYRR